MFVFCVDVFLCIFGSPSSSSSHDATTTTVQIASMRSSSSILSKIFILFLFTQNSNNNKNQCAHSQSCRRLQPPSLASPAAPNTAQQKQFFDFVLPYLSRSFFLSVFDRYSSSCYHYHFYDQHDFFNVSFFPLSLSLARSVTVSIRWAVLHNIHAHWSIQDDDDFGLCRRSAAVLSAF